MAQHNEIGKKGEALAQHYLQNHGYTLLTCNWRFHKYELDIVCTHSNQLIIVEVKTRSSELFGQPYEAVTPQKIRRIVAATQAYIYKYHIDQEVRFDIVSILISDSNKPEIKHIKDAFLPPINAY